MRLEETEAALARLYTDPQMRERFFASPAEAGRELGLTEEETASLAALDRARVELFADSLVAKRFGEVRGQLPRLERAMGEEAMRAAFVRFARAFVPEGVDRHAADALAFAADTAATCEGPEREAARFDAAVLGLFYRLDGRAARVRMGPAVAFTTFYGRRVLLVRPRRSSRFRSYQLPV